MSSDSSSTSTAWFPHGDSWQQGGGRGASNDTLPIAAGPHQSLQASPARYRPPHHHFTTASSTESWAPSSPAVFQDDRRNGGHSGSMQHLAALSPPHSLQQPRRPPQPPEPTHSAQGSHDDAGHREGPRDKNLIYSAGNALAARIRNPPPGFDWPSFGANGNTRQAQPSGENSWHRRHRRHSEPSQPNRQPLKPLRPTIPPDHSLLTAPTREILENPAFFVEKYREDTEICSRAKQYTSMSGALYHMVDVFEWWWSRTMDRIDRKEHSHITLDPHEKILRMLQDNAEKTAEELGGIREEFELYPMNNYYAEQMIPKDGFTADQVHQARNNPRRWSRRDEKESKLYAEDPTGELMLVEKWRAATAKEASERYRKLEAELERRQELEAGSLPYDSRSKYKETSHQPRRRGFHRDRGEPEERNPVTRARFDANNRIDKGDGSPRLSEAGWKGGGAGGGGRRRGRWRPRGCNRG